MWVPSSLLLCCSPRGQAGPRSETAGRWGHFAGLGKMGWNKEAESGLTHIRSRCFQMLSALRGRCSDLQTTKTPAFLMLGVLGSVGWGYTAVGPEMPRATLCSSTCELSNRLYISTILGSSVSSFANWEK